MPPNQKDEQSLPNLLSVDEPESTILTRCWKDAVPSAAYTCGITTKVSLHGPISKTAHKDSTRRKSAFVEEFSRTSSWHEDLFTPNNSPLVTSWNQCRHKSAYPSGPSKWWLDGFIKPHMVDGFQKSEKHETHKQINNSLDTVQT